MGLGAVDSSELWGPESASELLVAVGSNGPHKGGVPRNKAHGGSVQEA